MLVLSTKDNQGFILATNNKIKKVHNHIHSVRAATQAWCSLTWQAQHAHVEAVRVRDEQRVQALQVARGVQAQRQRRGRSRSPQAFR